MIDRPVLNIIHFDDDIFEIEKVSKALSHSSFDYDFNLKSVLHKEEFLEEFNKFKPHLALLDIHSELEGTVGIELSRYIRDHDLPCVIIMRSSLDDPKTVRQCIEKGADDFISKNSDKGELCLRIINSFQLARVKRGNDVKKDRPKIFAVGQTMEHIADRIPNIVNSAISSVFVQGPSGTGKEVVAKLFEEIIQDKYPFVAINCGAITGSLLESELFGHVKGAFTGANSDRKGLLETVDGGWVFFDEVATLSPAAQVALLRVLENGEVLRVGSSKPVKVDVRIISATNEDIEGMVQKGTFRQDLWQRINESTIVLPPLAERKDEVPSLIKHFCASMRGGPYKITQTAIDILCDYDWQEGNIRELRNCLRAMTELSSENMLTPISIPEFFYKKLDREHRSSKDMISSQQQSGSKRNLTFQLNMEHLLSFDELSDVVLCEYIRAILDYDSEPLSLRKLSLRIGIPRTSLTKRLKSLVSQEIMSADELEGVIKV